jgi:hypothetical protein
MSLLYSGVPRPIGSCYFWWATYVWTCYLLLTRPNVLWTPANHIQPSAWTWLALVDCRPHPAVPKTPGLFRTVVRSRK